MSLGWVLGWFSGGARVVGGAASGSGGRQRPRVQVTELEG